MQTVFSLIAPKPGYRTPDELDREALRMSKRDFDLSGGWRFAAIKANRRYLQIENDALLMRETLVAQGAALEAKDRIIERLATPPSAGRRSENEPLFTQSIGRGLRRIEGGSTNGPEYLDKIEPPLFPTVAFNDKFPPPTLPLFKWNDGPRPGDPRITLNSTPVVPVNPEYVPNTGMIRVEPRYGGTSAYVTPPPAAKPQDPEGTDKLVVDNWNAPRLPRLPSQYLFRPYREEKPAPPASGLIMGPPPSLDQMRRVRGGKVVTYSAAETSRVSAGTPAVSNTPKEQNPEHNLTAEEPGRIAD